jgi:hypothetical protein
MPISVSQIFFLTPYTRVPPRRRPADAHLRQAGPLTALLPQLRELGSARDCARAANAMRRRWIRLSSR